MKKYLIIAVAVIVAGACFFGMRIGCTKCETNALRAQSNEMLNITNIKRNTDEVVFNTGVGDIRRVLRAKYTIAD